MSKTLHRIMRGRLTSAAVIATAAAVITAGESHAAGNTATPTGGSAAATNAAAAAIMVGGTTFPTMPDSLLQQVWTTLGRSLGLQNPTAAAVLNVSYPAQLAPFTGGLPLGASVAKGAENLLAMINAVTETYAAAGRMIIWGISQGAMVLNTVQRILTNDPTAPPSGALTFVRVADPATALTGMLNFLPNLFLSAVLRCNLSGCASEEDSQYDTVVVVNQYDAFADFPDNPLNILAVANALVGLIYRHGQTAFADLETTPPENVSIRTNAKGATITTYLVPSPFLPLTQPLRDIGIPADTVDKLDAKLRPIIDAGYAPRGEGIAIPVEAAAVAAEPAGSPTEPIAIPVEPTSTVPAPEPVEALPRGRKTAPQGPMQSGIHKVRGAKSAAGERN